MKNDVIVDWYDAENRLGDAVANFPGKKLVENTLQGVDHRYVDFGFTKDEKQVEWKNDERTAVIHLYEPTLDAMALLVRDVSASLKPDQIEYMEHCDGYVFQLKWN